MWVIKQTGSFCAFVLFLLMVGYEMAGWHHWLHGRESEWTPGVGDGQGGLACCDSWGRKESNTTERLNWTELNLLTMWLRFEASISPSVKWGCTPVLFTFQTAGKNGWESIILRKLWAMEVQPRTGRLRPRIHYSRARPQVPVEFWV